MSHEYSNPEGQGTTQLPAKREVRVVHDVIPLLDTDRFEHMQRVSTVMAAMSLIPDGLKGRDEKQTAANCFLVVNQATGWEMDPFAVAQMVSVIKGRLTYEGKLIHAVIEKKLGIRLDYKFTGEKGTIKRGVIVSGKFDDEDEPRTIDGTVDDWKTDGWAMKAYDQRLRYRGAREWCRAHAPGVLAGVYSRDEMEEEYDDGPPEAPKNIEPTKVGHGESGRNPESREHPGPQGDDPGPGKRDRDGVAAPGASTDRGGQKKPPKDSPIKRAEAEEAQIIDDDGPPSAPVSPAEIEDKQEKAPTADSILDSAEVDLRACKTPADVKKVQETYAKAIARLLKPDQQEFENMVTQALTRTSKK